MAPYLAIIVSALISIAALAYTVLHNRRHDLDKMRDDLMHVRQEVAVLKTQVSVFWGAVHLDAAKILHSPDPARARTDELIDKYTEGRITRAECAELLAELKAWRDEHDRPPGERLAAALFIRHHEANLAAERISSAFGRA